MGSLPTPPACPAPALGWVRSAAAGLCWDDSGQQTTPQHQNLPQNGVLLLGSTPAWQGRWGHPWRLFERPTGWDPQLLVQPPIVRCSAVQGGSRPRTKSQPKKPLGPSRGGSGQPGPELPLWGGGSSHPWSSATAHCAPPPHQLTRCSGLWLEPVEDRHGVSSAQPHSPRRGGLLGKGSPRLCQVTHRRGIARIYRYWVDSTVSGPSQFLQGLPREAGVRARWGSHVLAAVTSQPLDAPGDPSIPLPRYDGAAGWELGASTCFSPPCNIAPSSHFGSSPDRDTGDPPWDQECQDAPAPAPPPPPASRLELHMNGNEGRL